MNGINGNTLEGSQQVKVKDIVDTFTTKRDLVLVVVLGNELNTCYRELKQKYKKMSGKEADDKSSAIELGECFEAYEEEETLSGNDQWYCRDCKEHRDIHKKLELYTVPKIMILHLRRFRQKQSANNGGSGFFNMAYA